MARQAAFPKINLCNIINDIKFFPWGSQCGVSTYIVRMTEGTKMQDRQAIRRVITETLTEAFEDVRVDEIDFKDEMEDDGTEVLKISVVFEGALDPRKMPKVIADMRHKINSIPEVAFPVLSFISQSEIANRKRATR